jgi:hypothetical protein
LTLKANIQKVVAVRTIHAYIYIYLDTCKVVAVQTVVAVHGYI